MRYYIIVPVSSISYSLLNKTTTRIESNARKNVAKTHACLELLPNVEFSQIQYRIYNEAEILTELSSSDWTENDEQPQLSMVMSFFKKMIS